VSDDDRYGRPPAAGTGDTPPEGASPAPASSPPERPDTLTAPRGPVPTADEPGLEESFLTVWLQPRATIRRIVTVDPTYWVVPLAAFGGITQVLSSASRETPTRSLATILLGAVVGGPLFGVFALYVAAWLTRLTGRWWLHGLATPDELRTALGWANLAHVVALPLWLLATAAFGMALFTESGGELASRSTVYVLFAGAVVGLQVWGVAIASAGVAEVQGFRSAWKGFWNILLAVLLVVAAGVAVTIAATLVLAVASGLVH